MHTKTSSQETLAEINSIKTSLTCLIRIDALINILIDKNITDIDTVEDYIAKVSMLPAYKDMNDRLDKLKEEIELSNTYIRNKKE